MEPTEAAIAPVLFSVIPSWRPAGREPEAIWSQSANPQEVALEGNGTGTRNVPRAVTTVPPIPIPRMRTT
jgi:hypothetical protein